MKKKGFTLVELLVVIALLGIIVLVAVPSILQINKQIKERTLAAKKDLIVSAAKLYAQDHHIRGASENACACIKIYTLINEGYIESDVDYGHQFSYIHPDGNSRACNNPSGCMKDEVKDTLLSGSIFVNSNLNIEVAWNYTNCNVSRISITPATCISVSQIIN